MPFNIDDVRTRVPFPAKNVENLSFFEAIPSNGLWNNLLLFDAFFSICQPMYVKADGPLRLKVAAYFLKLIKRTARKNKTGKVSGQHLKYGEVRNDSYGKWENLITASFSMLALVGYFSEFKLTWGCP